VVDRREHPSYGYRSVHVIITIADKPVEVQVRTSLQHAWAEFSEKLSDVVDPTIKYGGGTAEHREVLTETSDTVALIEEQEMAIADLNAEVIEMADPDMRRRLEQRLEALRSKLLDSRRRMSHAFNEWIAMMDAGRGVGKSGGDEP